MYVGGQVSLSVRIRLLAQAAAALAPALLKNGLILSLSVNAMKSLMTRRTTAVRPMTQSVETSFHILLDFAYVLHCVWFGPRALQEICYASIKCFY